MAVMSFTIVYLGPHMLHAGVPQGSRRVPVLKKKKERKRKKRQIYLPIKLHKPSVLQEQRHITGDTFLKTLCDGGSLAGCR